MQECLPEIDSSGRSVRFGAILPLFIITESFGSRYKPFCLVLSVIQVLVHFNYDSLITVTI